MKSPGLFLWLRVIATLLTFVLLFSVYDFRDGADRIAAVGLTPFAASAILLALCTVGMAWKWKLALRDARFGVLLHAMVSSYFYTILPSGQLGGEVSKVLLVKSRQPDVHHVVGSIVFDKITGLLGLVMIGGLALAFSNGQKQAWQVVVLAMMIVICVAVLASAARLTPLIEAWAVERPLLKRIRGAFLSIMHRIARYARDPVLLAQSIALGVLTQGAVIAIYQVLATALGISIAPADLIAAVVLANLAALIPISVAGLGVREAGLTVLLAQYPGVDSGQALALSLSAMGVLLLGAMAGALIELYGLLSIKRDRHG